MSRIVSGILAVSNKMLVRPHSVYFMVNESRQAYFYLVRGKKMKNKISLLALVGKNGSILANLNTFISTVLKKSFFLGLLEEKIKIKAGRLLFFLSETISPCQRTR